MTGAVNDALEELAATIRLLEDREVAIYRHLFGKHRDQRVREGKHQQAAMFHALAALLDDELVRRAATLDALDPDREDLDDADWTTPDDL